jgi:hypothetical protein
MISLKIDDQIIKSNEYIHIRIILNNNSHINRGGGDENMKQIQRGSFIHIDSSNLMNN